MIDEKEETEEEVSNNKVINESMEDIAEQLFSSSKIEVE